MAAWLGLEMTALEAKRSMQLVCYERFSGGYDPARTRFVIIKNELGIYGITEVVSDDGSGVRISQKFDNLDRLRAFGLAICDAATELGKT